ncbi:hypothetical protein DL96DRAFT_1823487 [Flagelloscypha sp. PMI_526]|nr:hypothetical protein DL96DRAFT_1823487 [Flagelloscypha sp. PMI_526]
MSLGPSFIRFAARNTHNLEQGFGSSLSILHDLHLPQPNTPLNPQSEHGAREQPFDLSLFPDFNGGRFYKSFPFRSNEQEPSTETGEVNLAEDQEHIGRRSIEAVNKGVPLQDLLVENDVIKNSDSDFFDRQVQTLDSAAMKDVD